MWFVYVAVCFTPTLYNIYILYAYGLIWPVCAESAVKHQQNKEDQNKPLVKCMQVGTLAIYFNQPQL